ncbi:cytochrome d ubiquinol oxidase subunit II [Acidisoma sp. 7E03]
MTTILAGQPLLPVLWAGIMAFVILAYVVLDGFDLGIGLLFAVEPKLEDRDVMVNTVAPVWDGNETWLVLGGSGLYAVFPGAYSTILPAVYPLLIIMLMGLIFRGVAFEFRFRAVEAHRRWWDWAFLGGSLAAGFTQGTILGALIDGTTLHDGAFAGTAFDWLAPFPLFCGIAVVFGYALLGSSWLILRTGGPLQARMRRRTLRLGVVMLILLGVVSLWTPFLNVHFVSRWFSWPGYWATAAGPLLSLLLAVLFFRSIAREDSPRHEATPFLCALGWFTLGFLGLGFSIFPMIVPPTMDIWQASSAHSSQIFTLVGMGVMIPLILAYNVLSYYIFRGKVEPGAHYH